MARSVRRSNSGFTLVEVMISGALASVLALAVLTLATRLMTSSFSVNHKLTVLEEQRLAFWTLERSLARAEMVSWSDTPLDGSAFTGGQGAFALYGFTRLAHGSGRTNLLAVYGQNVGTATTPSFVGTGLFFRTPTATSPGELYYVVDRARTGTISANRPESVFSNIVELEIRQPRVAAGNRLTAVNFRMVTRSYEHTVPPGIRQYCPQADVGAGACTAGLNYRDLERTLTLLLPMNASTVPFAKYNLPLGGYFHAQ